MAETAAKYSGTETKGSDSTSGTEKTSWRCRLVRLRQNLQRSQTRSNQNQQQTAAEKSRYEQLQKQRENMEKELGERTKEEILSQIQL